jgi:hypothetical protein
VKKNKKNKNVKYLVGDCSAHEIEIARELNCEDEADGEFVFDSLEEAKVYCLDRIDFEIEQLEIAKARILKAKP